MVQGHTRSHYLKKEAEERAAAEASADLGARITHLFLADHYADRARDAVPRRGDS